MLATSALPERSSCSRTPNCVPERPSGESGSCRCSDAHPLQNMLAVHAEVDLCATCAEDCKLVMIPVHWCSYADSRHALFHVNSWHLKAEVYLGDGQLQAIEDHPAGQRPQAPT